MVFANASDKTDFSLLSAVYTSEGNSVLALFSDVALQAINIGKVDTSKIFLITFFSL